MENTATNGEVIISEKRQRQIDEEARIRSMRSLLGEDVRTKCAAIFHFDRLNRFFNPRWNGEQFEAVPSGRSAFTCDTVCIIRTGNGYAIGTACQSVIDNFDRRTGNVEAYENALKCIKNGTLVDTVDWLAILGTLNAKFVPRNCTTEIAGRRNRAARLNSEEGKIHTLSECLEHYTTIAGNLTPCANG
jgi:hypothetical protein